MYAYVLSVCILPWHTGSRMIIWISRTCSPPIYILTRISADVLGFRCTWCFILGVLVATKRLQDTVLYKITRSDTRPQVAPSRPNSEPNFGMSIDRMASVPRHIPSTLSLALYSICFFYLNCCKFVYQFVRTVGSWSIVTWTY